MTHIRHDYSAWRNAGWLLFLSVVLWSFSAMAQNQVAPPDTLAISVSNISIDKEFSLRGLNADFPFPVLTTISVVDQQGNPVLGLADTLGWLGPADTAQVGLPVSEIWRPVVEYHLENPNIPADPDIFNQLPPPLFTEVRETTLLPTSTMLVMDASGSMSDEIEDAKTGARLYVQQMRPVDKAGVVIFGSQIKQFQGLTDNQAQLNAVINRATAGGATILYDAIMRGLLELRFEDGRRGVIVYTDGRDNGSTIGPQAVIDTARVYNIPVFTIALGDSTNEVNLTRVADETGGLFFKVATAEEMQAIYLKLAQLFQNYYLMAHSSPDPNFNDTFRVVDVSVNIGNYYGNGTGQYFVPAIPIPESDIGVTLSSITDTTVVIDGDSVNAVQKGEQYQYVITVRNLGPSRADTVNLFHFLPDSVELQSASVQPDFVDEQLAAWNLVGVEVGESMSITMSVTVAPELPEELLELTSVVNVTSANDPLDGNNADTDTIRILFVRPPIIRNYDLALSQVAITDTNVVIAGDSVQAAVTGSSYRYTLTIENHGPGTANNFTLFNGAPDSVEVTNSSIPPSFQTLNTFFWRFDSLAANDRIILDLDARVADTFESLPFALFNTSEVTAANDTSAVNDSTTTLVYAIEGAGAPVFGADLVVSQRARTAATTIIGADTVDVAEAGEQYFYEITVANPGTRAADNLVVVSTLPDSVVATGFDLVPELVSADSIRWRLGILPPQASLQLRLDVMVAADMPLGRNLLINRVEGRTPNETPDLLGNNTAVDTVYNFVRPQNESTPLIEARPPVVDVGDSIAVRVQVRVPNVSWDLWVIFADGRIDSSYADNFVRATALTPNQWVDVLPRFSDTRLLTDAEQEPILFELRTVDVFGDFDNVRASVTVQSNNALVLDRNVFVASREDFLNVRFKLNSNRLVRIDLFDVAGSRITKLVEAPFSAGWNELSWNGLTETGEKVGSGLYMVALRSGRFTAMRKVMVVR